MRTLLETKRWSLPLVGAFACLIAASWVPPVAGFVLFVIAFGLLFDGCTILFARATGVGGLRDYKQ